MSGIEFENELQKMRYEYYKLYSEKILPILRPFEVERRKLYRGALLLSKIPQTAISYCLAISYLIIFVLFFIFFPLAFAFSEEVAINRIATSSIALCLPSLVVPLIFSFISSYLGGVNKKIIEFQKLLKKHCLNDVVKIFGDLKWKHNAIVVPNSVYEKIGYDPVDISGIRNFDSFVGVYNNIKFRITEIPSCWDVYNAPCFKDCQLLLYFKISKKILSCIKITPRKKMYKKFNIKNFLNFVFCACIFSFIFAILYFFVLLIVEFARSLFVENFSNFEIDMATLLIVLLLSIFTFLFLFKGYVNKKPEKAKLEFEEFNRKFKVEATDQVDARYIITPTFMERYVKASKMFKKGDLHFHIEGNEVIFWTNLDRNLFEFCDMLTPLDSPESVNNLFKDLSAIYYLIDTFKFDEKTGL